LSYLSRYATNGVYWDEWNWAELVRRSYAGTLTFGNLWCQHNKNRMLFSNLIMGHPPRLEARGSLCRADG